MLRSDTHVHVPHVLPTAVHSCAILKLSTGAAAGIQGAGCPVGRLWHRPRPPAHRCAPHLCLPQAPGGVWGLGPFQTSTKPCQTWCLRKRCMRAESTRVLHVRPTAAAVPPVLPAAPAEGSLQRCTDRMRGRSAGLTDRQWCLPVGVAAAGAAAAGRWRRSGLVIAASVGLRQPRKPRRRKLMACRGWPTLRRRARRLSEMSKLKRLKCGTQCNMVRRGLRTLWRCPEPHIKS